MQIYAIIKQTSIDCINNGIEVEAYLDPDTALSKFKEMIVAELSEPRYTSTDGNSWVWVVDHEEGSFCGHLAGHYPENHTDIILKSIKAKHL